MSKRTEATAYLKQVAKFLKSYGCDVTLYTTGKAYYEIVGYGDKSLGGIVYEGSVPFRYCDSLADTTGWNVLPEAPKGFYFEPSTEWAIALYEV